MDSNGEERIKKFQQVGWNINDKSDFNEKTFQNVVDIKPDLKSAKEILNNIVNSSIFGFQITVVTVFILVADDIRILSFDKTADITFGWLYIIAFGSFLLELLLTMQTKKGQSFSFFYWLDFVACFSTLIDVMDIFLDFNKMFAEMSEDGGNSSISGASKASRVGTKTTRIIRIIRLTRLIRVVKLQRESMKQRQEDDKNLIESRADDDDTLVALECDWMREEELDIQEEGNMQESRVGKLLSDNTTKKVISFVLILLVLIPMFELTKIDPTTPESTGLNIFLQIIANNGIDSPVTRAMFEEQFDMQIQDRSEESNSYQIMWAKVQIENLEGENLGIDQHYPKSKQSSIQDIYQEIDVLTQQRSDERTSAKPDIIFTNSCILNGTEYFYPSIYTASNEFPNYDMGSFANDQLCILDSACELRKCAIKGYLSAKESRNLDARFSLMRTTLVCILLTISSLYFNKDANELILQPIEQMIDKIRKITRNPIKAIQEVENEVFLRESEVTVKDKNLETKFLEDSIQRIGALLVLGQGETGSEIIAQNMNKEGVLSPIIEGKKVYAVYGFCEIKNFTEVTEVLNESVLLFVNKISSIVHSTVDEFCGSPNKNMGDSFLTIWKFPDSEILEDMDKRTIKLASSETVNSISDMSLICFLKIIAKLNRKSEILEQQNDEGIVEKIPMFKVEMGFGLHIGWGIEGAIGSNYKIDATYLSPHLNITAALKDATKKYDIPLLMTEDMYEYLSPEAKKECRALDKVLVKGSAGPKMIQTCDTDVSDQKADPKEVELKANEKKRLKISKRLTKEKLWDNIVNGKVKISELFSTDPDILMMKNNISQEFIERQNEALELQIKGNWAPAMEKFTEAQRIKGGLDGPARSIMKFIESKRDTDSQTIDAPEDWKFCRPLKDEK